jgi:hypothetical protein
LWKLLPLPRLAIAAGEAVSLYLVGDSMAPSAGDSVRSAVAVAGDSGVLLLLLLPGSFGGAQDSRESKEEGKLASPSCAVAHAAGEEQQQHDRDGLLCV